MAIGAAISRTFNKSFSSLSPKQLYIVDLAMNCKESVELSITFMARKHGLITSEKYRELTFVIVTTFTSIFVLTSHTKFYSLILNAIRQNRKVCT
jgi:hypothetical protein